MENWGDISKLGPEIEKTKRKQKDLLQTRTGRQLTNVNINNAPTSPIRHRGPANTGVRRNIRTQANLSRGSKCLSQPVLLSTY